MVVVAMAMMNCRQALNELNDIDTEVLTHIERQFLKHSKAVVRTNWRFSSFVEDDIVFKGVLFFIRWKTKNRS
jgi:hydroxymethylbilane synthase